MRFILFIPHPGRKYFIGILATVYVAIALSPMSYMAMRSKTVAHAITGECVGDCSVCGCSQKSILARSCCCAESSRIMESIQPSPEHRALGNAQALSERSETDDSSSSGKRDCCSGRETTAPAKIADREPQAGKKVLKCGCPLGKGSGLSIANASFSDILPYTFGGWRHPDSLPVAHPHDTACPTSLHAEPPDPPPEITCNPLQTLSHT